VKAVSPLAQRPNETLVLKFVKTQSPFIAEPALVHIDVSPRQQPEDSSIAMIDSDVTSRRAAAANRIGAVQEPDAALEAKVSRCQSPNRTYIDNVPGIRIVERLIFKGPDRDVIASSKKLHLARAGDVVEETYAP
jgi:hypothetical protein